MHRHHEPARVPSARGIVWSVFACAYAVSLFHLAITVAILTGDPGRTGLLGAAAVSAVAALCLFAAAGVAGYVRDSLLAAAWGYVPGLLWVLVTGLSLAEARTRTGDVGSLGLVALVLVDPLVWVCFSLAVGIGLAATRGGHRGGVSSAEPGWRRAVPQHVGALRDVRATAPAPAVAAVDADPEADAQEALERLLPIGSDLPASRGLDVGGLA